MTWQQQMDRIVGAFHDAHPFGKATINLGDWQLNVLVADTVELWARGMTGRTFDGTDGMLFVMPKASTMEFHMAGVNADLWIYFFDEDGHLVDSGFMEAGRGRKRAKKPYTYALELADEENFKAILLSSSSIPRLDVGALRAQATKATQDEANYRPAEDKDMACGNCVHFTAPNSCQVVDGSISETATSDFFSPVACLNVTAAPDNYPNS